MPDHVASISYGKDSMAMLEVIHEHGLPLDRIITAQVWFDKQTPGDYPEMYEFKTRMDEWIKERYGIEVEHFKSDTTFKETFYRVRGATGRHTTNEGIIYGWPRIKGPWCNKELKMRAIAKAHASSRGCIEYIGIAADETERIARHGSKPNIQMPLVEFGITEADAYKMCENLGCLAPTYKSGARDGCWFCHNQGVDSLRRLRRDHPALWAEMLELDAAGLEYERAGSTGMRFKPDGTTVHDYDARFRAEDEGLILPTDRWDWSLICPQRAAKRKRIQQIKAWMKK